MRVWTGIHVQRDGVRGEPLSLAYREGEEEAIV